MGQPQSSSQNNSKLISNWQQHPHEADILVNLVTNQQIHRYYVKVMDPEELHLYNSRLHEHYSYICRVVYYHPEANRDSSKGQSANAFPQSFYVYTDRMLPIAYWTPNTTIMVLKGFRRLFTGYGPIKVEPSMIGQNQRGEVKVWINSNPVLNHPIESTNSEEQMLADLAAILMHCDKNSAGPLISCKTFSQALRNLAESQRELSKEMERASNNGNRNNGPLTTFHPYSYRADLDFQKSRQYQNNPKLDSKRENSAGDRDQYSNNQEHRNRHIPFTATNNECWTVRHQNEDRGYISQGKMKRRINAFELANGLGNGGVRNANSSMKNNAPNSLDKNNHFHQVPPSTSHNFYQANNHIANHIPSNPNANGNLGSSNSYENSVPNNLKGAGSPRNLNNLRSNGDKETANKYHDVKSHQILPPYPSPNPKVLRGDSIDSNDQDRSRKDSGNNFNYTSDIPSMIQQRKKYAGSYANKSKGRGPDEHFHYEVPKQNQISEDPDEECQSPTYGSGLQEERRQLSFTPKLYSNYFPGKQAQEEQSLKLQKEKADRMQTFTDINHALHFHESTYPIRNKTQEFDKPKNDVPSFIPRRRQQIMGDNLSHDIKALSSKEREAEKNRSIEQRKSGKTSDFLADKKSGYARNIPIKKDAKSQNQYGVSSGSEPDRKKDYLQSKEKYREKREENQRKFMQTMEDYGIAGYKKDSKPYYRSSDTQQKDDTEPTIATYEYHSNSKELHKHSNSNTDKWTSSATGYQESKERGQKSQGDIFSNKGQYNRSYGPSEANSMETSSMMTGSCNPDESKKKLKLEMAQQLKQEFGSILSWGNEEQPISTAINHYKSPPKDRHDPPSYQGQYQAKQRPNSKQSYDSASNANKVRSKVTEKDPSQASNDESERREKIQSIISKYADGVKDQLIKEKVEKKKATFAQLKKQAMKILSDDFL